MQINGGVQSAKTSYIHKGGGRVMDNHVNSDNSSGKPLGFIFPNPVSID